MSVARAQREISSNEFVEWAAYFQLDPFGEERADLRHGILCALIANAFRGKGQRIFKPIDFVPRFDKPKKPDQDALKKQLVLFARAHNAAIKNNGDNR